MMNADLSTLAGQRVHYSEVKRRIAEAAPRFQDGLSANEESPKAAPVVLTFAKASKFKSCHRRVCDVPPSAFDEATSKRDPSVDQIAFIQMFVARHFHVYASEIMSDSRAPSIIPARHVAIYFARKLTPLSTPQIGRAFQRDHTVILHAVTKIKNLIAADPEFALEIEVIELGLSALL